MSKASAKTDLWMPLWIGDYLADTMSLSTAQHGAYLLLLMAYWRNRGPLKNDDEDLRGIAKADSADWPALRLKVLERFFVLEPPGDVTCLVTSLVTCDVTGHVWRHKRADLELSAAMTNKELQRARTAAATAARLDKQAQDAAAGCSDGGSSVERDESRNVPRNVPRNVAQNGLVTSSTSPSPSPIPSGSSSVAKATDAPGASEKRPQAASSGGGAPTPPPAPSASPTPAPVVVPAAPAGVTMMRPSTDPLEVRKRNVWRAGKSVLDRDGVPDAQKGTFLGKLAGDYGFDVFATAVESCTVNVPAGGVREYLKATCQRLAGERASSSSKQAALEAGNDAVAATWAAKKKGG